jgi:hypothetical protein
MKKYLFLSVIFALALAVGCKKKVESIAPPPPPPPPVEKVRSQQEFMKGLVSMIPQLKSGEVITVNVDKEKVTSNESKFYVSLFPLEFITPAEEKYIVKYMFPSVVWRYERFQLPIASLPNYFDCREQGEKVWFIKESPNSNQPFEHSPTLLVEAENKEFWVLNQKGDEMPLRENW